jgi:flagellar export protein FliJ
MPRFVFKLQAALDLRAREEKVAQRELAERQRDANVLREELLRLNDNLLDTQKELRTGGLTGRLDPDVLSSYRRYTNEVARRGQSVMRRLQHAEGVVAEARTKLAGFTARRRAMEKLRENQKAAFLKEVEDKELSAADDDVSQWLIGLQREEDGAADAASAKLHEEALS